MVHKLICDTCGTENSRERDVCKQCGDPLAEELRRAPWLALLKALGWTFLLMLLPGALLFHFWFDDAHLNPLVFLGGYVGGWAVSLALAHWTDGTLLTFWGLPVVVLYEAWSDALFSFEIHRSKP